MARESNDEAMAYPFELMRQVASQTTTTQTAAPGPSH